MKIIKLTKANHQQIINQAVAVLKNGGLIIYPTETVYGAGVDAGNQKAVNKLISYKSRREGKPLSIVVADQKMATQYVNLNQQAKNIYQRLLPGPFTVISQGKQKLADNVESEFKTLGIRIPDYPLIIDLVKRLAKPITATSANASYQKRPYTINDVLANLSSKQKQLIDLIIDAGRLPPNKPSTVIDTTLSTAVVLRQGDKELINSAKQAQQKALSLISASEPETQTIAGKLMLKEWDQLQKKCLIIALSGKLGAGKTIFTKGLAQFLKIKETITSPSYNYLNEYHYQRGTCQGMFFHLDMWKISNQEEFELLGIKELIKAKNLIVIEWWDQVKDYFQLNSKAYRFIKVVIKININQHRQLVITE